MDDLVIWGFIFPLVLAFGLLCFYLGYTTPRAAKVKTKPKQLLEPEPSPTLETWRPAAVATELKAQETPPPLTVLHSNDSFERPPA